MNILQRKMFAQGDVATTKQNILPLYEKHAKGNPIVDDRGMDPIFDSFLDRYGISPAQYAEIHQKAGNRVIYDPGLKPVTPFLDLFAGSKALKGIGNILLNRGMKETGEYAAVKATGNMGPPLVTPIMKPSTTLSAPGRSAAIAVSLPLVSGAAAVPQDDEAEEAPLVALDQTQVELDKIKAEADAKAKSKAEKEKANKLKTKQEIENVNAILKALDLEDEKNREAFIQKRQERKNRNTGIFLNEMSKAAAGTDNLADAIAIGAANASDAVMNADEAEELAKLELLKIKQKEDAPTELKESDIRAIAEEYSSAAEALGKSTALKQELGSLRNILATGNATGASGFAARLADKIQGFFGADGEIKDATAARNLSLFLEVRLVEAVLDEKGKTISDADRKLIKDIVGNLESPVSNKATVINLLGIVDKTLDKKIADASKKIKYNKTRYGERIPELAIFDSAEGIDTRNQEEEEEVSIADREDVIK